MRINYSKYGNKKTIVDGVSFDSVLESQRWKQLQLLERAGTISDLQRQVRFEVIPKCGSFRAKYYVADFVYKKDGQTVVEDTKGVITDVFRLKQHLMRHVHGIDVIIIKKGDI